MPQPTWASPAAGSTAHKRSLRARKEKRFWKSSVLKEITKASATWSSAMPPALPEIPHREKRITFTQSDKRTWGRSFWVCPLVSPRVSTAVHRSFSMIAVLFIEDGSAFLRIIRSCVRKISPIDSQWKKRATPFEKREILPSKKERYFLRKKRDTPCEKRGV